MLAFTPLQVLAAGWVVMVAAMMTPLLFVPLVQVHSASLKRVQPLATGFFAAGYFAIWIVAGSAFLSLALTMRIASGGGRGAFLVALAVATIWQMSPGKQAALNRCHGRRPLAAFGAAAYWDSLMAGLTHGGWCLASCWALMLAALVAPAFHFAAMLFVSLYVWAERLEHPRKPEWSLGVPTRVLCAFAWRLKNWDLGGYATRLFAQSRE
ncbi:MAG: DUF2182 domain-containing protein [Pseudomonadota bacterium]|nr:DUF2182 domain-containing protein [Pseudomonadota bacterium]